MKKIPKFNDESEESEFWLNNDSTEYINWSKSEIVTFENLKPSAKSISLRLPEALLRKLKNEANKKDIPYQSLMKMILAEGIQKWNNSVV